MVEEKDIKVGLKFRIYKANEATLLTEKVTGKIPIVQDHTDYEVVGVGNYECACKQIANGAKEFVIDFSRIMESGQKLPEDYTGSLFLSKKDEIERIKRKPEQVSHPSHYAWLREKCLVEPIDICRHLDFNIGCAVKYLLRKGKKEEGLSETEQRIQDLNKARFYIEDEITSVLGGKLK